ncbi:uncharacterized protein FOMMEDRAFT_140191 [Fomitiporia mediterranea MF3/22]|uniref:uncharacterized protein n=1 Tax=Fomitiporia mediterranea (strain MF3/22) TaxID=694068 RepID=UPI0004409C0D|nr:uncharacterized protein FOMMEDRAFT_140191 [Fomitiporia mediterranea MF3/22]EJD04148.1 hypothetical protein FOMMEDRAFT_140191 [Fomitiporia mediterranea MF3/22]
MPSCRRKHVLLTEPSSELLEAAKHDTNKEVYLLAQTGEVFDTYEAYAARMSFYKLKQFQCDVTGKSGLDYFQALESEQQEARTLHSRFPEPLKAAVLSSVQWQVMGRLDHLVEAVHDRYKDRYFPDEKIFVDVEGNRYAARLVEVFPPRSMSTLKRKRSASDADDSDVASSSSGSSGTESTPEPRPIHSIGGDLSITLEESVTRDDPASYTYRVRLLEEEAPPENDQPASAPVVARRESGRVKEKGRLALNGHTDESNAKFAGSLMDVHCDVMSRDRLVFSKSLLRRFLRECLDRDSSLASPWTVKPVVAQRLGIPTEMPDHIRAGVEKVRKDEIDKRKKVWEEKEAQAEREGRLTKKMIREREREAKALAKAEETAHRQREQEEKAAETARIKAEKRAADQAAKEEAERAAAEKAKLKKKAVRYPTEDLDVRINDRDKKAGMQVRRPKPSRSPDKIPFGETKGAFEGFLAVWNFLICFGQPLHLSFFSFDDFEHALRHCIPDLHCNLLAEVHSVLIYNLRTVPFTRHAFVLSLHELKKNELDTSDQPSVDVLMEALADVGNTWERVPLKHNDGRAGWQDALIGCLKDHATLSSFPKLRSILNKLLFDWPESSSSSIDPLSPGSSPLSSPTPRSGPTVASPAERYFSLPPEDRISILQFMCDLAVSSKQIHSHLESCEEQLTAYRKEKIELNRQKKQLLEEMNALVADSKKEEEAEELVLNNEASDIDSDGVAASEDASEAGSTAGRRSNSTQRQLTLRLKAQQGQLLAKQRELARQKLAHQKQALAEHRRLDEEVGKLERRLEGIERDFRKTLGMVRLKPLGKDRFYNRIWWFDGCGTSSLVGSGGAVQYATGRLFIQGPSEFDQEILNRRKEDDIAGRRLEEEGEDSIFGSGDWACYTDLEELDQFMAWLNSKGVRELALKNALSKWYDLLSTSIRKRQTDLGMNAKIPEARRSQRGKNANSEIARESYMLWTNRKAVN